MFSRRLLPCVAELQGDDVVPRFLGPEDEPWLGRLLEECHRFEGQPRRLWDQRLRDPLPCYAPPAGLRLATQTLSRLVSARVESPISPRQARRAAFLAGARYPGDRPRAVAEASAELGVGPADLDRALLADLPPERRLQRVPSDLSARELALRVNLGIARTLLCRAASVELWLYGNARAVVRHAHLRGLICTVCAGSTPGACHLSLSGPFALFRRTLVYGRALGGLVPRLAWCDRFRLRAPCTLEGRTRTLNLRSGDPIFPSAPPRPFDSKVEQRFAREFGRLAPDWDLAREPQPVEAEGTLVFPDFALWRRDRPAQRWLLEIVGFWTPEYLRHKLSRLRAAGLSNLVLCIDAERNCSDAELPQGAAVIRYRRAIDVAEVLALLERQTLVAKPEREDYDHAGEDHRRHDPRRA